MSKDEGVESNGGQFHEKHYLEVKNFASKTLAFHPWWPVTNVQISTLDHEARLRSQN